MARATRSWYLYTADDHGAVFSNYAFAMLIPDAEAADATRGWVAATPGAETLNKRMKPRHIQGRNTAGEQAHIVIPDVAADLWTGAAIAFTVNGVSYTITGYIGEKRTAVT